MAAISEFVRNLPKIELHAHLNGSVGGEDILELGAAVFGEHSEEFLKLTDEFKASDVGFSAIWEKFKFVHSLTATRKGLSLVTKMVIAKFSVDGIYLELRTTPKANEHMTRRQYLETVLEAIEEEQKKHPGLLVRLLPSIDRGQSVADAEETLREVLDLRKIHRGIIPGIDLSGHPEKGSFGDFEGVLEKARQNGLKLALHCAEVDNPGEVKRMVNFGMDRCGHGTYLTDEQVLQLGRANVGIECCLTSNVMSQTVSDYTEHHFKRIYANPETRHIPVICTDDWGVFDTTPSKEYALAESHFGLEPKDVLAIALNAADQSFASASEKATMRQRLQQYYEKCFNKASE